MGRLLYLGVIEGVGVNLLAINVSCVGNLGVGVGGGVISLSFTEDLSNVSISFFRGVEVEVRGGLVFSDLLVGITSGEGRSVRGFLDSSVGNVGGGGIGVNFRLGGGEVVLLNGGGSSSVSVSTELTVSDGVNVVRGGVGVSLSSGNFSSFSLGSLDNIFDGFLLVVLGFNVVGVFIEVSTGFDLTGLSIDGGSVGSCVGGGGNSRSSVSRGGVGRSVSGGGVSSRGSAGVGNIGSTVFSNGFSAHSEDSLDSSIEVVVLVVRAFNDGGLSGVSGGGVSGSFVGLFLSVRLSSRVSRSSNGFFLNVVGFLDSTTLNLRNLLGDNFDGGKAVSLLGLDSRLVKFDDQFVNGGSLGFIFNEELLEERVEGVRVLDSDVV